MSLVTTTVIVTTVIATVTITITTALSICYVYMRHKTVSAIHTEIVDIVCTDRIPSDRTGHQYRMIIITPLHLLCFCSWC